MSEQPAEPVTRPPADDAEALHLLRTGEIDLEGRMLDASNVTLVGTIRAGDVGAECVYKPVAGERPRASNFVYGSTKSGLDAFFSGLGDSLVGSGVSVLVVRPGFVRSKMTEGLPDAPLSTTPQAVADAITAYL